MRKMALLGLLVVLNSCSGSRITADSPEKFKIENLAKVISEEKLNKVYPEAEIAEGLGTFEEGTVERAYSVLYPETKDEIIITWQDRTKNEIYQIFYGGEGKWKSKEGIEIGTSYEDLLRLNGGPIKVYGFGWDYSGAVDWNEGKLADSNVRVFLAPQNAPPKSFYGDQVIEADIADIENLKLRVRAILFQKDRFQD